ncbi:hypothetical protein ON010_g2213 [Phytophthora cinnamomi]|nr:hypothetical protein ON010_g2213 [Phytophthora cinnamomi]
MFKNPAMSYHPVFITTFILENQLVFVTGPIDFIAKIIPHFSILFGLTTISEAVVRRSKTFNSVASTPPPQVAGPSRALTSAQRSRWRWMHASVKIIFCLWGAGVLGCHLHAAYQAHSSVVPGCLASTRPWLSIRASCFSYVVNCHSRDIVSPSDEIFENLNIPALTTLTFAHCPALRMPSALQRFKNLMILHVYNSTVLEWIEQNSLTPSVHTRMIVVAAVRTKFLAGFPTGLLKPLPTSLVSIQFSITDLKSLPDTLASFWHPMASVSFEYGELTTFPASLLSLQTASLSLKRNRLQNVPQLADLPPDLTVTQVILGGNPLSELPSSLKNPTDFFGRLDLEGTTISSLPAWTKAQVLAVVYMNGTPYCSDTVRQFNAQCSPRSATDNRVEFPISLMDELYAIDKG